MARQRGLDGDGREILVEVVRDPSLQLTERLAVRRLYCQLRAEL